MCGMRIKKGGCRVLRQPHQMFPFFYIKIPDLPGLGFCVSTPIGGFFEMRLPCMCIRKLYRPPKKLKNAQTYTIACGNKFRNLLVIISINNQALAGCLHIYYKTIFSSPAKAEKGCCPGAKPQVRGHLKQLRNDS